MKFKGQCGASDGKKCMNGFFHSGACLGLCLGDKPGEGVTTMCCDEKRSAHFFERSGGKPPANMVDLDGLQRAKGERL